MKLYDISDWCRRGDELTKYPYVGEIDLDEKDYDFGLPLNVGGIYYSVGVLGRGRNCAGVRKIKISDTPRAHHYEDNIICPYCGYEDKDSWDSGDSDDEQECGRCGATFGYERVVVAEYNSYPVKPPEVVNCQWKGADAK